MYNSDSCFKVVVQPFKSQKVSLPPGVPMEITNVIASRFLRVHFKMEILVGQCHFFNV